MTLLQRAPRRHQAAGLLLVALVAGCGSDPGSSEAVGTTPVVSPPASPSPVQPSPRPRMSLHVDPGPEPSCSQALAIVNTAPESIAAWLETYQQAAAGSPWLIGRTLRLRTVSNETGDPFMQSFDAHKGIRDDVAYDESQLEEGGFPRVQLTLDDSGAVVCRPAR